MNDAEIDEDPLERLERNNRSTRMALLYLGCAVVGGLLVAAAVALWTRWYGACDAGGYLCTRGQRTAFVLVPLAFYFLSMIGCLALTYWHWRYYIRWRPWMFVSWTLSLVTLGWMVTSGSLLIA